MRIEIVRNKYDGHSTTQMKFPFIDETNYRKMLLFDPTNCLTTIGNIYGKLRLYLLYIKNITAPEPKYENWKMKIECTTKQLEHFIRAPKKKRQHKQPIREYWTVWQTLLHMDACPMQHNLEVAESARKRFTRIYRLNCYVDKWTLPSTIIPFEWNLLCQSHWIDFDCAQMYFDWNWKNLIIHFHTRSVFLLRFAIQNWFSRQFLKLLWLIHSKWACFAVKT